MLALSQDVYPTLEAAVAEMVTIDRRFEPRDELTSQYAALYEFFAETRAKMQPVWADRTAVYEEAFTGETQ